MAKRHSGISNSRHSCQLSVETLESRVVMYAAGVLPSYHPFPTPPDTSPPPAEVQPVAPDVEAPAESGPGEGPSGASGPKSTGSLPGEQVVLPGPTPWDADSGVGHLQDDILRARHPLTSIPILNSNPGARNTLYLDFDGHQEDLHRGRHNVLRTDTRGAFSIDSDNSTFTDEELNAIEGVWDHVLEDFAPFDVNVTTVEPPAHSFSDGTAVRIVIGGDDDFWYRRDAGGVYIPGFPHIAFVFTEDRVASPSLRGNRLASSIAGTVSHEAGHAYGLDHQQYYNADGSQPETVGSIQQAHSQHHAPRSEEYVTFDPEYNPGQRGGPGSQLEEGWVPIMGGGGSGKRDTWHYGPTTSATRYQDDLAELGRRLGFRADDHGASVATATWLATLDREIQASGIIGGARDADWFAFYHGGGEITLQVDEATVGANLDALLELRNAAGHVLRPDAAGRIRGSGMELQSQKHGLGMSISGELPRGTYHAVVRSQGAYGDLGQYTLTGNGISTAGYSSTGPQVIWSAPANSRVSPFTRGPVSMLVTFDKPINTRTFSSADVTFISPRGFRTQASRVQLEPGQHGDRTFRITASLWDYGSYRMEIGPYVADKYGNNMDQDHDGRRGESQHDRYSTTVTRLAPNWYNISNYLANTGYNFRSYLYGY